MGEQISDGFDGMEGSLWRNVMSVECGNECLRVEHNLFCTNSSGLGVLSHITRVGGPRIVRARIGRKVLRDPIRVSKAFIFSPTDIELCKCIR